MNLHDSLSIEISIAKEIRQQYEDIGAVGAFGMAVIDRALVQAYAAMADGDVVAMLRVHEELKGIK